MIYTWKKENAGVTRFIKSSVYAVDCNGRIYTLASVNSKDGYKFKPIAGACKDKALYAPNFTTQEAAIDAALKDNYTVYEFGNEDEFYAWLGQRYAATVLPAAEPKEKNVSAHSLHILEDKIASVDRIFGRKLEELAMMVGKLQANENRHTQPSENRDGQKRADGFYVVSYPGIEELFVVRSKDNVWYFLPPGKEVKYSGYLTIHSKLNMYE